MLIINIKFIRIYEYIITKIMLDFKLSYIYLNIKFLILLNLKHAKDTLLKYYYQIYTTLQTEIKILLSDAIS